MQKKVLLKITAGEPFKKLIRVKLPAGRTWWLATTDFELRMQAREAPDEASLLVLDMAQFLTPVFFDADTVYITLEMTGEQTRLLTKSAYYDCLMSDPGTDDARLYPIAFGRIRRRVLVTRKVGST